MANTGLTPEGGEVELTPFEGMPVTKASIEIPGAAGGLRDAMAIEPEEFHQGDTVYVVLECEVGKVRFQPVDKDHKDGAQVRVHVFDALAATIVDGEIVDVQLKEQKEKIAAARERLRLEREAEKGIKPLPFDPNADPGDGGQGDRVRLFLGQLKRAELRELCDGYGIEYADRDTASEIVEMLAERAPQIEADHMAKLQTEGPALAVVSDPDDDDEDEATDQEWEDE